MQALDEVVVDPWCRRDKTREQRDMNKKWKEDKEDHPMDTTKEEKDDSIYGM